MLEYAMSLFPTEDILTKEIESWRSFGASLNSEEYREILNKMTNNNKVMNTLIYCLSKIRHCNTFHKQYSF